jgi:membrane protein YdbS with pleckstrin-like domain
MDASSLQTTVAISYVVAVAAILLGVFLLIGLPTALVVWLLKSRAIWVRALSGAACAVGVSVLVPLIALQFQDAYQGPINIMRAD